MSNNSFRVGDGRGDFENPGRSGHPIKAYLKKSKELKDQELLMEDDETLTPLQQKIIYGNAAIFFLAFICVLNRDGQSLNDPTRFLVYYCPRDDFYTILFVIKYSKEITGIAELRYYIHSFCLEKTVPLLFINNYEVGQPIGNFDASQCFEGPLIDLQAKECSKRFLCKVKLSEGIVFKAKTNKSKKNQPDPVDSDDDGDDTRVKANSKSGNKKTKNDDYPSDDDGDGTKPKKINSNKNKKLFSDNSPPDHDGDGDGSGQVDPSQDGKPNKNSGDGGDN